MLAFSGSSIATASAPFSPETFSVDGKSVASKCGELGDKNHPIFSPSLQPVRAFPTAEGFGAMTKGGRGGRVIYVTNLNNDGPGSLRAALLSKGPRTVLFNVSGLLEISTPIFVTEPYLTLDGRTAPGDGVIIKVKPGVMSHPPVTVAASEIIIRYMRFRPGPFNFEGACCGDPISIGSANRPVRNVIIDHSSFSWGQDENIDTYYDTSNVTIQHSIISEALNQVSSGGDPNLNADRTGKGAFFGSTANNFKISVHHNLMAFNPSRNVLFGGSGSNSEGLAEYVNNYVYGWRSFGLEIGRYAYGHYNLLPVNIINNYYESMLFTSDQRCPASIEADMQVRSVIYAHGNVNHTAHASEKTLLDPATEDAWKFLCRKGGTPFMTAQADSRYRAHFANPKSSPEITVQGVAEIRELILRDVGATKPTQDAVDQRIIRQVREKTGRIINDPAAVGGYPLLATGQAPKDSDLDGLPDTFEIQFGLNPKNSADGAQDNDGDGYSNLEEYLNHL